MKTNISKINKNFVFNLCLLRKNTTKSTIIGNDCRSSCSKIEFDFQNQNEKKKIENPFCPIFVFLNFTVHFQ